VSSTTSTRWSLWFLLLAAISLATLSLGPARAEDDSAATEVTAAEYSASAEAKQKKHSLSWKRQPKLVSRWVEELSLETPLPEYPRPQMVRSDWLNLNGEWEFLGDGPQPPELPQEFTEKALVPSATQAVTSCLEKEWHRGWYRKTVDIPAAWSGKTVLLNFEAVGGLATVYFNSKELGKNSGSFKRFTFELPSDAAGKTGEIVVHFDDTDPRIPRGKPDHVSGIWQTVWLEPVSARYIYSFQLMPNIDSGTLAITADTEDGTGFLTVVATASVDGKPIATSSGEADVEFFMLDIPDHRLWSPEDPFLYDLVLELKDGDKVVDRVESYFGMREISTGEVNGQPRIFLNNKVYYQAGLLDQGTWPDSFYTPPSDKCLKWEVETAKKLGFNCLRKHVKIESARWYYWCDKVGMLVWQDMPCQMYFNERVQKTEEDKQFARDDLQAMIKQYYNHPSIISWVIFNETWGQFEPKDMTLRAKRLDKTRLINATSHIWANKQGRRRYTVDYFDEHCYERFLHFYDYDMHLPSTLGEFGGIGYLVKENTEEHEKYRGYGPDANSPEELLAMYQNLVEQACKMRDNENNLCAIIYTELTDFYHEINGFITFDRKHIKVDAEKLREINMLYRDPKQPYGKKE